MSGRVERIKSCLEKHFHVTQPDSPRVSITQELLDSYKLVFGLLCEHGAAIELQDALVELNGYNKLHRASVRDAQEGIEKVHAELSEHAIKVLSWVWYRNGNTLDKTRKSEAVDALMEMFFLCEAAGEKALVTVAQHCVWALGNITGTFPYENGRLKRAIEVATLSSYPNVFQSERIVYESAKLLKSFTSAQNLPNLGPHLAEWVPPVLRALCYKPTKTSDVALDAFSAVIAIIWDHLKQIESKLAVDSETWQIVSDACEACLKDAIGSRRRIAIAKVLGMIILLYGGWLRLAPDYKINSLTKVAASFMSEASPERFFMLKQWRLVLESFSMEGCLLSCIKILQKPMREVFREGKEPDSQVRKEGMVTWSYLMCLVLESSELSAVLAERDQSALMLMKKELLWTLLKALGDYDVEVRSIAVDFACTLIATIQKCEFTAQFNGDHDSSASLQRRQNILTLPVAKVSGSCQNTLCFSIGDLCEVLDATLRVYPDLGREALTRLFKSTGRIWAAALCRISPSINPRSKDVDERNSLTFGLAARALGSLCTLEDLDHVEIVITAIEEGVRGSNEWHLIIPPVHLLDWIMGYRRSFGWRELESKLAERGDMLERAVNLAGGSIHQLASSGKFWEFEWPVDTWLNLGNYLLKKLPESTDEGGDEKGKELDSDIIHMLLLVFERPDKWELSLKDQSDVDLLVNELCLIWTKLFERALHGNPKETLRLVELAMEKLSMPSSLTHVNARAMLQMCILLDAGGLKNHHHEAQHTAQQCLAARIGDLTNQFERAGKSLVNLPEFGVLLDCAAKLISKTSEDRLGFVFDLLFVKPCDHLVRRAFPTVILQRMKQQMGARTFELLRYQIPLVFALQSTDRGVRALAVEFWNLYSESRHKTPNKHDDDEEITAEDDVPLHLTTALLEAQKEFPRILGTIKLSKLAPSPQSSEHHKNLQAPGLKQAHLTPPTSVKHSDDNAPSTSMSSSAKKRLAINEADCGSVLNKKSLKMDEEQVPRRTGRYSDKRDPREKVLGIVTYTNLDPSQSQNLQGIDADDPPTEKVYVPSTQGSSQQPPMNNVSSVKQLSEELDRLSGLVSQSEVALAGDEDKQAFHAASLRLVQALFMTAVKSGRAQIN